MVGLAETLSVIGLAFVGFMLMLAVLVRVQSTCAGRCTEAGEPGCEFCPERTSDPMRGDGR